MWCLLAAGATAGAASNTRHGRVDRSPNCCTHSCSSRLRPLRARSTTPTSLPNTMPAELKWDRWKVALLVLRLLLGSVASLVQSSCQLRALRGPTMI